VKGGERLFYYYIILFGTRDSQTCKVLKERNWIDANATKFYPEIAMRKTEAIQSNRISNLSTMQGPVGCDESRRDAGRRERMNGVVARE